MNQKLAIFLLFFCVNFNLKLNAQIDDEYQENNFQGQEEQPISFDSGRNLKYIDDNGVLRIGDYDRVTSMLIYRNSKLRKITFVKGNNMCGKAHVLTANLFQKEIKRSSSFNPIFRLSSKNSTNNGSLSNLPTKKDLNKTLYLEIQERFILYRNKLGKTSCPICHPLSEEENNIAN
jgi:hypothetical protein